MVYDEAHALAKALKNCNEYKSFLEAKKVLDSDDHAKKMVTDFLAKRMEMEYDMLAGRPDDKSKVEQLQKMYELVAVNARAGEFLDKHMRFQRLMADVYKIIGESISEGMDFFGNK